MTLSAIHSKNHSRGNALPSSIQLKYIFPWLVSDSPMVVIICHEIVFKCPSCQRLVEQFHRTMKRRNTASIHEFNDEWDEALPANLSCYEDPCQLNQSIPTLLLGTWTRSSTPGRPGNRSATRSVDIHYPLIAMVEYYERIFLSLS